MLDEACVKLREEEYYVSHALSTLPLPISIAIQSAFTTLDTAVLHPASTTTLNPLLTTYHPLTRTLRAVNSDDSRVALGHRDGATNPHLALSLLASRLPLSADRTGSNDSERARGPSRRALGEEGHFRGRTGGCSARCRCARGGGWFGDARLSGGRLQMGGGWRAIGRSLMSFDGRFVGWKAEPEFFVVEDQNEATRLVKNALGGISFATS